MNKGSCKKFHYKSIDELFHFITDEKKTPLSYQRNHGTEKKKKQQKVNSNMSQKQYTIKFNFLSEFNLIAQKEEEEKQELIKKDVALEKLKQELKDSSIQSEQSEKIIPVFTEEWLRKIANLSSSKF